MNIRTGLALAAIGLLLPTACQNPLGGSTSKLDYAALSGTLGEAINGTIAQRGSCGSTTFDACTASRQTRHFSTNGGDTGPCTRGLFDVYGKVLLTFESSTCSLNAGEYVVRTLENHYLIDRFEQKWLTYTDAGTVAGIALTATDLADFETVSRSGGSTLRVTSPTTRTLSITGIHRRTYAQNGQLLQWHTLYTPAALNISALGSLSTIASGTLKVKNNPAQATVTQTLSNLVYNQTCCYPESGQITNRVESGSGSTSTFTIQFNGNCGVAKVDGVYEDLPTCGS